jgi:Flp pilus assembly protein TadD
MQVGRYDLARGEASKASHSHMGEPVPLFMLGKAYYLEDNKEDAKTNLQAAIDHGLAGPDLQEAKTLLKKL